MTGGRAVPDGKPPYKDDGVLESKPLDPNYEYADWEHSVLRRKAIDYQLLVLELDERVLDPAVPMEGPGALLDGEGWSFFDSPLAVLRGPGSTRGEEPRRVTQRVPIYLYVYVCVYIYIYTHMYI